MNDLTKEQVKAINATGLCPMCGKGDLLFGPSGGCSVNVKCNNLDCRKEFWIGIGFGEVIWGGDIDRDDPALYSGPTLRELKIKDKT